MRGLPLEFIDSNMSWALSFEGVQLGVDDDEVADAPPEDGGVEALGAYPLREEPLVVDEPLRADAVDRKSVV